MATGLKMADVSVTVDPRSARPSRETWALRKSTIKRLYLDEDKTLSQVMEIMKRDHNFQASIKMFKRRLTLWKLDCKNLRRSDVKQIARQKVERDAVNKTSQFSINGRNVDVDNVQRYLKKYGFASLEEFDYAASPGTQDTGLICTTPLQMSNLPIMHRERLDVHSDKLDRQDTPQYNTIATTQCDQFSLAETSINERSTSPREQDSEFHYVLSLSPEARSRRLLSLSPIQRTPIMPEALLLPEQMLSIFHTYLKGFLETDVWEIQSDGHLSSKIFFFNNDKFDWASECYTAAILIKQSNVIQARYVLSQICTKMKLAIRSEWPDLFRSLLCTTKYLHKEGLHEIAAIFSRHAYHTAIQVLGKYHPVVRMCEILQKPGVIGREFNARLLDCQLRYLRQELGPRHFSAMKTLHDLAESVEVDEAVCRVRAALTVYESTCSDKDAGWLVHMVILGRAFFRNGQFADAERCAHTSLCVINAAPTHVARHFFTAKAFRLLSHTILATGGSLIAAEGYARQSVIKGAVSQGWGNPSTIRNMEEHTVLLRNLGRFEEAYKVESHIDDLLDPRGFVQRLG